MKFSKVVLNVIRDIIIAIILFPIALLIINLFLMLIFAISMAI